MIPAPGLLHSPGSRAHGKKGLPTRHNEEPLGDFFLVDTAAAMQY